MSSSLELVGAAEGAALVTGGGAAVDAEGLRSQKIAPMPQSKTTTTMAYFALLDGGTPGGGRLEGVLISGKTQSEGGSAPESGEEQASIAVL